MRIVKKKIVLIALLLYSMNMQARDVTKERIVPANFFSKMMALEISDCLVQFGSIYAIDSENISNIKKLAIIRPLLNCITMAYGAVRLCNTYQGRTNVGAENAVDCLRLCMRGQNIVIDSSVLKKSEHIVFRNRNADKEIKLKTTFSNKKSYQYIWLALNKILPTLMYKLNIDFCVLINLAELSELCRQKIMYQMISSEKINLKSNCVKN